MKSRELMNLGIPKTLAKVALAAVGEARRAGRTIQEVRSAMRAVVGDPGAHRDDPVLGALARQLEDLDGAHLGYVPRAEAAPHRRWGTDLEPSAVQQLERACTLPVAVRGALMPDAHTGYGLPIGGVLAVRNAVIPFAVGVDIACRMKMTVLDLPAGEIDERPERLVAAIAAETRFGVGASFGNRRRDHAVMDEDWSVTEVTRTRKDKAWSQLGTSGSGNHFVEFGTFRVDHDGLGVPAGEYLALLSHSGSRGTGSDVASHYSRLAMDRHPELPRELAHLAWLDLDTAEGQEYWQAMELMGRYAAANHACIHQGIARNLGAGVLMDLENHHNFAWKEMHDGEEVIVHRKGATPAGAGVLGIIPGSMASATYVARGRGSRDALDSASHGAGRVMSRTAAKQAMRWPDVERVLRENRVRLLSAGLDEAPMVYKNIDEVMAAQADLVEPIAVFRPRIVKMAPPGERPED